MSAGIRKVLPRVLFFGTSEFAATILAWLLLPDSPVDVVGVVTQPDKPAGRRQVLTPPPVKVLAQQRQLPVLQPVSLRRPAAIAALERFHPDLGIVAAYGRILRSDVLAMPRHGHLNVHASLLPRWRGAWPVGEAIRSGDEVTGVTIMKLDEGMDTGPVLTRRPEPIRPDDTTETLERRLATLGARLLVETIPGYLSSQIVPEPQDDLQATYCHPIRKEDGQIDWSQSAIAIERAVRAFIPWPVAHTTWEGRQLRILRAHVESADATVAAGEHAPPPGSVVRLGKGAGVATGRELLVLDEVQLEGKGVTSASAFVNGYRSFVGSRLGP
jgi:methionyl-tRNA formyltransferase